MTALPPFARPSLRPLRFWWALRRCPACDGGAPWIGTCGQPAVACVRVMGVERHCCAWHLEPMEITDNGWGLAFLARWLVLAP